MNTCTRRTKFDKQSTVALALWASILFLRSTMVSFLAIFLVLVVIIIMLIYNAETLSIWRASVNF